LCVSRDRSGRQTIHTHLRVICAERQAAHVAAVAGQVQAADHLVRVSLEVNNLCACVWCGRMEGRGCSANRATARAQEARSAKDPFLRKPSTLNNPHLHAVVAQPERQLPHGAPGRLGVKVKAAQLVLAGDQQQGANFIRRLLLGLRFGGGADATSGF
jgi:hypothetical protein